jgi:site-specific recombinase XerD
MSTELVDRMASVRAYLAAANSGNTRRAYATDCAHFATWCQGQAVDALPAPPAEVARYLAELADIGLKPSTIRRRAAAIGAAHRAAGLEPPTSFEGVKQTMRGIRRALGTRKRKVKPATVSLLATALEALPDTLRGKRDRALLAIGFAAARRRSELVSFNVEDIEPRPRGIVLHLGRSKTDQEGKGTKIPVPNGKTIRPVASLDAWLEASGITAGPIFREITRHGRIGETALSDRSVARIVKKVVGAVGIDADDFSGHSLRAGFITDALDRQVDFFTIMKQSGHRKVDTLKEYDRRENDFDHHAGEEFL